MAQINIPRLPLAPQKYDPIQINQMIQTLEQLIAILNRNYTPETLRDEDEQIAWFLG